jgi:hypothetical protein
MDKVIKCPQCERENQEGVKICTYCGATLGNALSGVSTRSLDDTDFEEGVPRWGSARFNQRTNLIIGVEGEIRSFTFDADEIEQLVMGRIDPKTGELPEINLSDYDALDKGVSRRHASIVRKDGSLYLLDLGSPNGTFLNGQKLVPNQARILRDGDDIRMGHLVVRITFERAERT